MAIVDDRGRMFGRFNPVDVFVFVLVVVMIPIAYAAYALFRTPPAKLRSVEPKQFTMGPNLRVRVNGTNLRPFMRVSFNTVQGRTFMIGSTETAEIDLPDLDPGTYDVVLYDYAQEVDRLSKALTILPSVGADCPPVGERRLRRINQTQIDAIRPGLELTQSNRAVGTVLAVGSPRPGTIRMRTGGTVIRRPIFRRVRPPGGARARVLPRSAPAMGPSGALCMVRRTPPRRSGFCSVGADQRKGSIFR
jgi:hypothetical protein